MFSLPALPYAYDDLAPTISETTMRTHHGKHHARYVEVTNTLLQARHAAFATLEEVVRAAEAEDDRKLFNNAAQAWNHAFFWCGMTSRASQPSGPLARTIETMFGSMARLKDVFVAEGLGHFGSGWVWLVAQGGALSIQTTHDGDTALTRPYTPLLVCDLWEHAYYLDHKNDRAAYLSAWWDHLVDWAFVEAQYAAARGAHAPWRYADAQGVRA